MFTLTLADYLVKNGHKVTVYSKFFELLKPEFENKKVETITDLEQIKNRKFDLAHIHHNICALEVRNSFPELPMVYMCHGAIPFLEQPPVVELGISKYLAVSEGVRDHLIKKGVSPKKIVIVRNLIDSSQFFEEKPINPKPRRALILSSRIDSDKENVVFEGCKLCGISVNRLGKLDKITPNSQLGAQINQADIVFSLGRGAMETMLCGRIPFVFDYMGGDGIVTPDNFYKLLSKSFSGRLTFTKYTAKMVEEEIRTHYSAESAKEIKKLAIKEFAAKTQIKKIIDVYHEVAAAPNISIKPSQKELVEHMVKLISTTKEYSEDRICRMKDAQLKKLIDDLSLIQSSRAYRLWQLFARFKKNILSGLRIRKSGSEK